MGGEKRICHLCHSPLLRITPAWAGKIDQTGWTTTSRRDHPRVGGEKEMTDAQAIFDGGLPPRGRGKEGLTDHQAGVEGITPA